MIYKANAGNKIAKSEALFNYLDKNEEKEFDESFFSDSDDDVSADEATFAIDNNVKGLGKDDSKYYMLTLNPSPLELAYIKSDPEKIKEYTRVFMDEYAKNFHREGVKSGADLVYFAKVEHHRYSRKTKKKKKGLNTHVHIVVSRKDKTQGYKLSPMSNAKASYKTSNKIKSAGFNRNAIKEESETLFDSMFDYKRDFKETFQYQNTIKNGTVEEKLKIKEIANKLEPANTPSIAIKNLLIEANSNGSKGELQELWRKMEPIQSLDEVLSIHKGLEPVNLLIPESIKATKEAVLFPLIKLDENGKGEIVDIVPYGFKEEKVSKLVTDDNKDGLIVFVVTNSNYSVLEKPQLLFVEDPLDAISYAQLNDLDNYIVIATAGSPSKKQLKQLEIFKNENLEKIVVSKNDVIEEFNANIISKTVDSSFQIQPFGKFKDFNEMLVSINEIGKKLRGDPSQKEETIDVKKSGMINHKHPSKTSSQQTIIENTTVLLDKAASKLPEVENEKGTNFKVGSPPKSQNLKVKKKEEKEVVESPRDFVQLPPSSNDNNNSDESKNRGADHKAVAFKEDQVSDIIVKGVLVGEMNVSKDQKKIFFTLQVPKENGLGFDFIKCAALGRKEVILIQKNLKKGDTVLVDGRLKPYSFRNKDNVVKNGVHLLVNKFKVFHPKKANSKCGVQKHRIKSVQKSTRIRKGNPRLGRKPRIKNIGISLLKDLLFSKEFERFLEAVAYMPPSHDHLYEDDYEDEIGGLQ